MKLIKHYATISLCSMLAPWLSNSMHTTLLPALAAHKSAVQLSFKKTFTKLNNLTKPNMRKKKLVYIVFGVWVGSMCQ